VNNRAAPILIRTHSSTVDSSDSGYVHKRKYTTSPTTPPGLRYSAPLPQLKAISLLRSRLPCWTTPSGPPPPPSPSPVYTALLYARSAHLGGCPILAAPSLLVHVHPGGEREHEFCEVDRTVSVPVLKHAPAAVCQRSSADEDYILLTISAHRCCESTALFFPPAPPCSSSICSMPLRSM
jgi:hypothetical protein